jgi:hypothetical protein
MLLIQIAWAAGVVGLAWLPLVDRTDGHLLRWLGLHDLPLEAVWIAPLIASLAGLIPTSRLLSLARRRHRETRRISRVFLVGAHLVVPIAVWIAVAAWISDTPPVAAIGASATPAAASITLAALRYPPAFVHRLSLPSQASIAALAATALLLAAVTTLATLPRPDGRSPGVLWGAPQSFNNIRPWIDATDVRGLDPPAVNGESPD